MTQKPAMKLNISVLMISLTFRSDPGERGNELHAAPANGRRRRTSAESRACCLHVRETARPSRTRPTPRGRAGRRRRCSTARSAAGSPPPVRPDQRRGEHGEHVLEPGGRAEGAVPEPLEELARIGARDQQRERRGEDARRSRPSRPGSGPRRRAWRGARSARRAALAAPRSLRPASAPAPLDPPIARPTAARSISPSNSRVDPSLVHDQHPIRHLDDLVELLGDEEDRDAAVAGVEDRLAQVGGSAERRGRGSGRRGSEPSEPTASSRPVSSRWACPPDSARTGVSMSSADSRTAADHLRGPSRRAA